VTLSQRCHRIAHSNWFHHCITAVILLAGLLIGLETDPGLVAEWGHVLHVFDKVILGIFTVEVAVKMLAEGNKPWRYFLNSWNVFDFLIVAGGYIEPFLTVDASWLMVLRLLRILRVLRLVTALPKLQLLVGALLKSMTSISYVGVLLFIMFYIYAVLGVHEFAQNDPQHFGNIGLAMLTLFRVVTLEGWTQILYLNMYGCDQMPVEGAPCPSPEAQPMVAVAYFVSFVMLGTMIIMNLFIGVIMNSMEEIQQEKAAEDMRVRIEEAQAAADAEIPLDANPRQELEQLHAQLAALTQRVQDIAQRLDK
jgi:voltage-gated sodium channel